MAENHNESGSGSPYQAIVYAGEGQQYKSKMTFRIILEGMGYSAGRERFTGRCRGYDIPQIFLCSSVNFASIQ